MIRPSKRQIFPTRSNIFTKLASCLDLIDKHSKYQHPPINVKNKQAVEKTIEYVIINRSLYWVLFFVQGKKDFIAGTKRRKESKGEKRKEKQAITLMILFLSGRIHVRSVQREEKELTSLQMPKYTRKFSRVYTWN